MCDMARNAKHVGVRELRQNLSVCLARVKKGQALTVTEHGQAVAELPPLQADSDQLSRLVAEGRVAPARRPTSGLPQPLRWKLAKPVSRLLDELREDSI